MFLNEFSNVEKSAFFSIAVKMTEADGVKSENEELLIESYLVEMNCNKDDLELMSVDDALSIFDSSSDRIKKCVYVELYSLSLCDELLSDEENLLLSKIIKCFNLSEVVVESINGVIYDITEDYKRLGEIIK